MGDMFAPIGDFIKDNPAQLHQGMAIENIVWLMAYGFLFVTILAAYLMIVAARRIGLPKEVEDELVISSELEKELAASSDGGTGAEPESSAEGKPSNSLSADDNQEGPITEGQ